MYERMLDKQNKPSLKDMEAYCGETAGLFQKLNGWMTAELGTKTEIRFPYGNQYGWGVKHARKSKHICDVFPEAGAFNVMLRLANRQFDAVYGDLGEDTKRLVDHKYPCGEGGWVHCRVLCREHLEDVQKLLRAKLGA